MKNAIKYYYNLNIQELHQTINDFSFIYQNKKYILYNINLYQEQMNEIFKLYSYIASLGILCHKIIANNNNQITTNINNQIYCLIEIVTPTRPINLHDIRYYMDIQINTNAFEMIKRNDWQQLWSKKIDFIEYQSKEIQKNNIISQEYIDYYTGIIENCISMLNKTKNNKKYMTINHNRVNKKTTTDDFYNPLTFIIDIRTRDLCEYIKSRSQINLEEIIKIIKVSNIQKDEFTHFFIRLMYPSVFLDYYEKTILKNKPKEKKDLLKSTSLIDSELKMLKDVYNYAKKIYQLPEIEWLNND